MKESSEKKSNNSVVNFLSMGLRYEEARGTLGPIGFAVASRTAARNWSNLQLQHIATKAQAGDS
eukprot:3197774-Amphidinium_carterae.1